jgi:hypothetical protein
MSGQQINAYEGKRGGMRRSLRGLYEQEGACKKQLREFIKPMSTVFEGQTSLIRTMVSQVRWEELRGGNNIICF